MSESTLISVNTVFHLLMTKLYMRKNSLGDVSIICYSINEEIPEIIKGDSSFNNKLIIDRTNYNHKLGKIRFIKKIKKSIKTLFNENKFSKIIVFKDNDIVNQLILEEAKRHKIKTTLIEEGLGLYVEPNEGYQVKKTSKIKQHLFSYPKFSFNTQGINSLIDEILVNSPYYLPDYKKKHKSISTINFNDLDKSDIGNLLNYFNTHDTNYIKIEKKKVILYIGQPLSEFNRLDNSKEQKKLKEIFNTLQEENYEILIKPHPSENLDKYNGILNNSIEIISDRHIPVELLPAFYEVKLALTFHSSSSYYLKKWYNIESISVANLFFELDGDLEELLKNFYNLKVAKNIDNLKGLLESSKK